MSTLEEIRQKAKRSGVYNSVSQDDWNRITDLGDLERLIDYKADWAGAQNDAARALASAGAENIRAKYGYSGGADGSTFSALGQDYSGDEFNFDPARSSRYQSAVKSYETGGRRAAEDALHAAASATGGVPSSYAVTAAAEAGGRYRAELAQELSDIYDTEYQNFLARKNAESAAAAKEAAAAQAADLKAAEKALSDAEKKLQKAELLKAKTSAAASAKTEKETQTPATGKEGTAGRLYTDPQRTTLNGSQPVAYYANILQKMVDSGATNAEIRAYLMTLITDQDGLTAQDRTQLIPYFWSQGT